MEAKFEAPATKTEAATGKQKRKKQEIDPVHIKPSTTTLRRASSLLTNIAHSQHQNYLHSSLALSHQISWTHSWIPTRRLAALTAVSAFGAAPAAARAAVA